jgi:hypothetical protein
VLLDDDLSDVELPAALGRLQRIDYRAGDRLAVAALVRALDALSTVDTAALSQAIRPEPPRSYRTNLTEVVGGDAHLNPSAQRNVVRRYDLKLWIGRSLEGVAYLPR